MSLKLIVFVVLTIASLRGNTITYTVTPTAGNFLYQFTLTNIGSSGSTLFDLFLAIPLDVSDIDPAAFGTPYGWGDAAGGLLFFGPDVSPATSFIQWSADFSGLYDIVVGSSLSGFTFLSSQQALGSITFALNGSSLFETAQEVSHVPEPNTLVLCVAVMIFVCRKVGASPVKTYSRPENGSIREGIARREIFCRVESDLGSVAAS